MIFTTQDHQSQQTSFLPLWFRQKLPDVSKIKKMKVMFRGQAVSTVCESAQCPNMGQCWGRGVAAFMILGDVCTRSCRFCAVKAGQPSDVDYDEPRHVAEMAEKLGLKYIVITSVTRDDLPDQGAEQFVKMISALRDREGKVKIELLIPDFSAHQDLIQKVVESKPDVLGHNIEMVRRLFPLIRPQADYQRSLNVLRMAKDLSPRMLVKTGFMVGLGETDEEVEQLMADLLEAGCDMLTIGQYLAPSKNRRHVAVERFVSPKMFENYKDKALTMGFRHVFSAPLVRSSYIAESGYRACCQNSQEN